MGKFIYGSLFLALVGMITIGCEKENDEISQKPTESTNFKSQSFNNKSAPAEDAVIYLHNASLASFVVDADNNNSVYSASNEPVEEMFAYVESYMKQNMNLTGIDSDWIEGFYDDYRTFEANKSSNSLYQNIVQGHYYNRIMTILNHNSTSTLVNQALDTLRDSLDNDINISADGKAALIQGILIGKESFEYWENNDNEWKNTGIDHYDYYNGVTKDRGKMAQADVESAVGGALMGAITGGPFGALAGATLGAAWGSAASAASQHFGWNWSWE